ncbi:MAG TPA: 6,7-dimethyl-8-ribityllumazine synthase [Flavisolibacter sp.]|nr:6,7-dimethyl-8-ribityllumazine synthase [Flavisolibacter sp.]
MADIANSRLLQDIEGIQHVKDALVVLVKTEWNAAIIDELEAGCKRVLEQYGVESKTIVVPGAVEIPFAIQQCWANSNAVLAFVALACVIRGDTPHFDYVCQSITQGVTQLNLAIEVPTIFGVLTVDTIEQANERIGGRHGHKGEEAAITTLKMMVLNQQLKERKL